MARWLRGSMWLALAALLLEGAVNPAGALGVDDLLFELQLVPHEGQAPRPFSLTTLDGKQVSLADQKGKVVLLYFWATW